MNTLLIFFHSIFPNLQIVLSIFSFFTLTTLIGYICLNFLFDIKKTILIPASMITGVYLFILYLAVFSYILKGPTGILIIVFLFSFSGLLILFFSQKLTFSLSYLFSIQTGIVLFIISCWTLFIFLIGGSNIYGGDVIAYWGFATSFANGNYPLMSPWQPSILANHHQGVYLYEGAVYALIPASIALIHTLFSIFIISAGFFLLWSFTSQMTKRTFLSLLCPLIFFISFGAIFIPLPENARYILSYDRVHEINKLPIFTDVKDRLGGSSNLNEVFYINHRVAAFSGLLLLWILAGAFVKKSYFFQLFFLVLLLVPIVSTDEVVLPSLGLMFLYWVLSHLFKNQNKKKNIIAILSAGFIFIGLFFIVGSALRDSLLTSSTVPRFQLMFSLDSLMLRASEIKGSILQFPSGFILYFPSLAIYFFLAAFSTILVKKQYSVMLFLGAIGAGVAFFLVEHTFYPGNQGRFLHLIYLLLSLNIVLNFLFLLKNTSKFKKSMAIISLMLFIPALATTSLYLVKQAKTDSYPNFNKKLPNLPAAEWFRAKHPLEKVIFIDGFLNNQTDSYLNIGAIQHYGLQVPLSPAFVKVHTPDIGVEAVDLLTTLNPDDFRDLNIHYIYIKKDQIVFLPTKRQQEIKNTDFFIPVYIDSEGTFFKVTDKYVDHGDKIADGSIRYIDYFIPEGSKIFLDDPYKIPSPLRAALWLRLKFKNEVYTEWRSGIFNYIETKMEFHDPLKKNGGYDYVIVGLTSDPYAICNCDQLELVWKMNVVKAYKVIK